MTVGEAVLMLANYKDLDKKKFCSLPNLPEMENLIDF